MIYEYDGKSPDLRGRRIFIAPGADVIGAVILEEDTSIWFNATLRGDVEPISVGRGSNVQDGSSVHTDTGIPTVIGEDVTIGHNCVIHGCSIGDGSLIGMGSIILSGARIGKNCLVGAGSLVTGSTDCPDGMLLMGSPAKVIKPLKEGVIAKGLENCRRYVGKKNQYLAQGNRQPGLIPGIFHEAEASDIADLFVIGFSGTDFLRPVNLFQQHDAEELMGEGMVSEG